MKENRPMSSDGPFQIEGVDEMYSRTENAHRYRPYTRPMDGPAVHVNYGAATQPQPARPRARRRNPLARAASSKLCWLTLSAMTTAAVAWNVLLFH